MQKILECPGYMSQLEAFGDDAGNVKAITGVRRCGKSALLAMFAERLAASGVPDSEILGLNHATDFLQRLPLAIGNTNTAGTNFLHSKRLSYE